jgi:hypothetical protein
MAWSEKEWTPEIDRQIDEMRTDGNTWTGIAKVLTKAGFRVSYKAVQNRFRMLHPEFTTTAFVCGVTIEAFVRDNPQMSVPELAQALRVGRSRVMTAMNEIHGRTKTGKRRKLGWYVINGVRHRLPASSVPTTDNASFVWE